MGFLRLYIKVSHCELHQLEKPPAFVRTSHSVSTRRFLEMRWSKNHIMLHGMRAIGKNRRGAALALGDLLPSVTRCVSSIRRRNEMCDLVISVPGSPLQALPQSAKRAVPPVTNKLITFY